MFDHGAAPFGLLQRVGSAARAEACAAGERLSAIGELFALRRSQSEESVEWAVDAEAAVTAEVAATLGISQGLAASHLRYARAMREQLPLLGRSLLAGDIDEAVFRTCVFRTGLILDDDVLAQVDARLALQAPRWGKFNRAQVAARIDQIVAEVDADAVRRRKERVAEREVVMGDVDRGLAEIHATLFATDAHAASERLTALAHTVCDGDPRTVAQRRADAFGALAVGADRLGCQCGRSDCPAGGRAASAVVIHVLADAATLAGSGTKGESDAETENAGGAATATDSGTVPDSATAAGPRPGVLLGFEGLIPPELIAELAKSARLRPLIHPLDGPPEAGYVPSQALADFVRHRDLTCRFPGCSVPATRCDIDHVVPYALGGPTHASNLSCKCRIHHLLKTFWGWRDEQLPNGDLIWTSPAGDRYVTHPGSALLFPQLCVPTGTLEIVTTPGDRPCTDRSAMMPRRRRTRDKDRATAIATERAHNHQRRTAETPPAQVHEQDLRYDDTLLRPPDPPPPF